MATFECPKCQASVRKESTDGPGCPCCGFGVSSAPVSSGGHERCKHCHEMTNECKGHLIFG